jgi:serine/threonine-protein kinase
MILGLKRGVVELADHEPEWEMLAAQTIEQLWRVLGDVAVDIQHVGSTSIRTIKAKPILDIAVAVQDFDRVEALAPNMESVGFVHRNWEDGSQILFAIGDYALSDGIVTHFIHIVKADSVDWRDYINFRDYLNENITIAKAYEDLKVQLATESHNDNGRKKYLAGKHDFVVATINQANIWNDFGRRFAKIEPLNKGWSSDKKYCVETRSGERLLLRVADVAGRARKLAEFEMLKRVAELDVPASRPVDFGTCNEGRSVYQLLTWIDGEDAETVLPTLSEAEQYALGVQAGEILRKIHTISAPSNTLDWATRFNRKTDRKIEEYCKCDLRFDGDDAVIAYLQANRHLLENRPQCYQHGDYHVGNMLISGAKNIDIIDWNRDDYGDPWEEFNRSVWCVQCSPHFATGQIHGYFGGEPPIEFWNLLAFYIGSNTLSSIYWAIPFGQSEIDTMTNQSQDVMRWYDNFTRVVPSWYLREGIAYA